MYPLGAFAPTGLDSKMSSATLPPQQLYEDEKVRNETLARKLVRLKAKFEREQTKLKREKINVKTELKRERELDEDKDERLDNFEASFEFTKGKVEVRIQQL